MYPKAEQALKRAKIALMSRASSVFYTTALFSLKQEFTNKFSTAAIDGRTLFLNPDFWMKQNPKQQIGLLVHEVLHLLLDHMTRIGDRDPERWNIAGDHVINILLLENNYELPEGGLHDFKYQGMSTEQVYAKLPKNPQQDTEGGIGNSDVIYPDPDDKEAKDNLQEHITEVVLRAATQAQMSNIDPGSIPGDILTILDQKLNPKLPWNVILTNYMNQFAKEDYSFQRANKRFLPDFYLPTTHSEVICNIAVAVDCSLSVSDKEFSYFITEINSIQQNLQPEKITVIDFDTKINTVQELTSEMNIFKELEFTGRGGTAIAPVLKWAEKNQPTVLLIFSDGEFREQPEPKGIPIVWLIHNDKNWKCPYGTTIHYNIEG